MKVLMMFIYNDEMSGTMEEIGLSLLAAVLRQDGHEVRLMMNHERELDMGKIQETPDLIGFTVYEVSKDSVYRSIAKAREIWPSAVICVGGVLATSDGKQMLKENDAISYAISGEGEETLKELVQHLERGESAAGIQGVIYRDGDIVVENEPRPLIQDLDEIPFAARDILVEKKMKIATISGSRGCLARCNYCATQLFWSKWRGRSVGNVVDELEMIVNRYQVRAFNFIDSSFEDPYNSLKRLTALAEEIVRRKLSIAYFADFRAEFQRKTSPEVMDLLKESGLTGACIGIESANDQDLVFYNKIARADDNRKIMDLFNGYGIWISPGFINFNPKTTIEGLHNNLEFLHQYGYDIKFFSKLAIFSGTVIYNQLSAEGLLTPGDKSNNQYRFVDPSVGRFSEFMQYFAGEVNRINGRIMSNLDFYLDYFHLILGYYRRLFEIRQDAAGLDFFAQYIQEYGAVKQLFNQSFYQWTSMLLKLAQDEVRLNGMRDWTLSRITPQLFADTLADFERLRLKLYQYLMRKGYESSIITF
ncbi:radical SAM protein [Paenibacillus sp. FSL H7-0756]